MDSFKYVIIGGGMVAGFAAKEMVKQGLGAGELCILSADTEPPYQRPPLSKGFLAGTEEVEKLFINKEPFYADSGIDLRLGARVRAVDLQARQVRMVEGGVVAFENLLFATGSSVRHVDLPGADLEGVYYLRTLDDCKRLKAAAAKAKSAVIVGGGFIGTELAARLGELGPEVTFTYREKRVLSYFLTPELSALYEGRYRAHGVQLSPESNAAAFLGNGKVEAVRLEGDEEIPADLVAVAVGVAPDVELAKADGLEVDRGIMVNEFLETPVLGVYAAGDAASWYDVNTHKHQHVEHEDNARATARHVARVMLGQRAPFDHVPMFWSDVYDISWEFWGETKAADQVVYRGELEIASFSVWWMKDGAVVGAMVTEDQHETVGKAAQAMVKARKTVEAAVLKDEEVELKA